MKINRSFKSPQARRLCQRLVLLLLVAGTAWLLGQLATPAILKGLLL